MELAKAAEIVYLEKAPKTRSAECRLECVEQEHRECVEEYPQAIIYFAVVIIRRFTFINIALSLWMQLLCKQDETISWPLLQFSWPKAS